MGERALSLPPILSSVNGIRYLEITVLQPRGRVHEATSGLASVLIAGSCAAEGVTDGQNGFLIEENAASLRAKLASLCADRAAMRRVGEGAMRELYLSWEDAVARAYARYEVVIDRYRSGAYPKHEGFSDDFFRAQGELMEAMSRVREKHEESERLRRELRDELRTGLGEARAELREETGRLRRELKENLSEARGELSDARERLRERLEEHR